MEVSVFCEHRCLLGEGPVWDSQTKSLFWIDIMNSQLLEYSSSQHEVKKLETGSYIGSFALTNDQQIIAALKDGLFLFDRITGLKKLLFHPEADIHENRFNDGKCDPQGRFWAGTMPMSEDKTTGSVYSTDGFSLTKHIEKVTVSNGLTWSLDQRYFYFIDSPTLEIVRYDYDASTGRISNKKTVVNIDRKEGFPDGMTIDAEGMLWVAHWDGWQVARWNPETGEKLFSIPMPVAKPTSICFGGEAFDELYVTSDSRNMSPEDQLQQPLAGATFVVKGLNTSGFELFRFLDKVNIP